MGDSCCIDAMLGEHCLCRPGSKASQAAMDLLIARTRVRMEAAFKPRRPILAKFRRPA